MKRYKKMKKLSFLLLGIVVCLFWLVPVASAAKFRQGDRFSLEEGKVFRDSLYVSAGTVSIDGTAEKDLIVCGGTVAIDGDVWGDLWVGGGTVAIKGDVGGDIRGGGGTITVDGRVGGDLLVAGGEVTVTKDSIVEGDLIIGGGTVDFAGDAYKKAKISAGQLRISGKIRDDLKAETGEAPVISSTAQVGGNFVYTSPKKAKIEEGAAIEGKVTHKVPKARDREAEGNRAVKVILAILGFLAWKVVFLIAMFITGVVVISLFPHWSGQAASNISEKPWPSLGLGILLFIVVPIAAIVFCVTVIGLPLGLMAGGLYVAFLYISWIVVGRYTGKMLIGLFKKKEPSPYWSLALGLVVLMIIMLIPIVNVFAYIVFVAAGLGASALASIGCYKQAKAEKMV